MSKQISQIYALLPSKQAGYFDIMPNGFREVYSCVTLEVLKAYMKNAFLNVYLIVLYFKACLTVSKHSGENHPTPHILRFLHFRFFSSKYWTSSKMWEPPVPEPASVLVPTLSYFHLWERRQDLVSRVFQNPIVELGTQAVGTDAGVCSCFACCFFFKQRMV